MSTEIRSVNELLQALHSAVSILQSADRAWPMALQAELADVEEPEATRLDELLHMATHESASALAFLLQDIEGVLSRVRVRRKFAMFTRSQFDRIIERGWSTGLAREMRKELPALSLAELSAQIKRLCEEWGRRS